MITWNSSFSIGIEEIDKQHMKLVEMVRQLHDAMKIGKGKEALSEIISSMLNYAVEHFATEEKYMKEFKYPASLAHKKEHEEFVKAAKNFYQSYIDNKTTSIEVMNFLKNWLVEHILGSDKKMGRFVCEKMQR